MGSNNGTGQPYWFRCAKCRRTHTGSDRGWLNDIELTGRKRIPRSYKGGARVCSLEREYHCAYCGHTGWSRHIDVAHKAGESKYLSMDEETGELYLPSYAQPRKESS